METRVSPSILGQPGSKHIKIKFFRRASPAVWTSLLDSFHENVQSEVNLHRKFLEKEIQHVSKENPKVLRGQVECTHHHLTVQVDAIKLK